jgi:alpha-tubulin suppressor-like RCC1 family protein
MRAFPALPALPAALAALAALALGCGDTLVDHRGTAFFDPGGTCQAPNHLCGTACVPEDASSCGDACTRCTEAPAGAIPICAAHACAFECTGGLLRCGDACCAAAAVAAGTSHTCAVTGSGTAKCWGRNDQGQVGTGSAGTDVLLPADVAGIAGGATAVAAGTSHACAVVAGDVLCWGANASGQLGDGTLSPRAVPVAALLPAGTTAVAVAAGGRHTCALDDLGAVSCWGDNDLGQLGTGGTAPSDTPVAVEGLSAVALAAGPEHTCAVTSAAGVHCWGRNDIGQVGRGYTSPSEPSPVAVTTSALDPYPPLAGALAIAAGGAHACATVQGASDLELWCWGSNLSGQLGIDAATGTQYAYARFAEDVSTRPESVAAGARHSCALEPEVGGLKCFGDNTDGQLGADGSALDKVDVTFSGSSRPPARVAAGGDHTCAILDDGTLWCWGSNARGELGDGTSAQRATPAPVSGR